MSGSLHESSSEPSTTSVFRVQAWKQRVGGVRAQASGWQVRFSLHFPEFGAWSCDGDGGRVLVAGTRSHHMIGHPTPSPGRHDGARHPERRTGTIRSRGSYMAGEGRLEAGVAVALSEPDLAGHRRVPGQGAGPGRHRGAALAADGARLRPPEAGLPVTLAVNAATQAHGSHRLGQ